MDHAGSGLQFGSHPSPPTLLPSSAFTGTLSMTCAFAMRHGAEPSLKSTPNEGTTTTLCFLSPD
jgi:hypothetical protein